MPKAQSNVITLQSEYETSSSTSQSQWTVLFFPFRLEQCEYLFSQYSVNRINTGVERKVCSVGRLATGVIGPRVRGVIGRAFLYRQGTKYMGFNDLFLPFYVISLTLRPGNTPAKTADKIAYEIT